MGSGPVNKEGALSEFIKVLAQRKALIISVMAIVVLAVSAVTALLPRWYPATTKIRVEKPEGQVKLFQAQATGYYDPYFIQDQFEIIQSERVLYPVIERLRLNERLGEELGAGAALPSGITYQYLRGKMLRVESRRSTSIIQISVYARDPLLASEIANEVAKVYAHDRVDVATSEQREGLAHLRTELEAQERAVTLQRDRVEALRKELNISGVDLNAASADMEIETVRQMQASLINLRVEAIGRKTRWERFREIPVEERLNLVNSELIQDSNIQNLLQTYLVADQNLARLKGRLGEAHPDLMAAEENRHTMARQLSGLLTGYERALEISYREAEARVTALEDQLNRAKVDQILSARDKMRPFEEAVQRLDDETKLLTSLKLTLRQREIDFQVPKKTIEILNLAEPARRPGKPSWSLNLVLAIIFGSILGMGAALLIDYFDTSFRNLSDIETGLQLPVLGVIPFSRDPVRVLKPASPEGEPYRVLHTNLKLTVKTAASPILAVVSAGPGEGKSTTLQYLAGVMAAAGERVLLIDSDLRRPTQHRLAGVPREPGLTDLLAGRAELEAVIRRTPAGLDLITSGGGPDQTLNLLAARQLREILAGLRHRYDWILLDSPPIIGVSDAALVTDLTEGVILLIQHRRHPKAMVLRAKRTLESLGRPMLGAILNQVPPSGGGEDYGYYTSNYHYYREAASPHVSRSSVEPAEKVALAEPGAGPGGSK